MKTCDGCKYASWKRAKDGRLHPSRIGKCVYPIKLTALPAVFSYAGEQPIVVGGDILRGGSLPEHCPCWQPAE
jgi:hypothetical protein